MKRTKAQQATVTFVRLDHIKDYVRGRDLLCGTDVPEAIEALISAAVEKAIQRAKENGRQVVRGVDI